MPCKGTVIEVYPDRAVLMNEHCEFVAVKTRKGLYPGDEIEYSPADIIRVRHYPLKYAAIAASFIIFCLISISFFKHVTDTGVYAYVGLDINPSLELGINEQKRVLSVTAYNEDGRLVIEKPGLLNSDMNNALGAIIRECQEDGYLGGDRVNKIAVSLQMTGQDDGRELMRDIDRTLSGELEQQGLSARTFYFSISGDTREQARGKNISPLKYMLWQEANKRGLSVPLRDFSLSEPVIEDLVREFQLKDPGLGASTGNKELRGSMPVNENSPHNFNSGAPIKPFGDKENISSGIYRGVSNKGNTAVQSSGEQSREVTVTKPGAGGVKEKADSEKQKAVENNNQSDNGSQSPGQKQVSDKKENPISGKTDTAGDDKKAKSDEKDSTKTDKKTNSGGNNGSGDAKSDSSEKDKGDSSGDASTGASDSSGKSSDKDKGGSGASDKADSGGNGNSGGGSPGSGGSTVGSAGGDKGSSAGGNSGGGGGSGGAKGSGGGSSKGK